MSSIVDYIEWRGDLSFRERPFNDVDNLILSELAYVDLRWILKNGEQDSMLLSEAFRKYEELGRDQNYLVNNPTPIFKKCAETVRFGNLIVKDFVDLQSRGNQFQFAAMTFELGDGTIYIAFRGTDNSLVGWREDLNFSFMESTPAQLCAADYLDFEAERTSAVIRVGGHSKGGNLAMFAAAFCEDENKFRILKVYSNDGPGFNEIVVENENYKKILDKVDLIIPEGSLIGVLLFNKQDKQIVQSNARGGASQHNPYSWLVGKNGFLQAEKQSSISVLLDHTLDEWLKRLDRDKKQKFVNIVFDTLESTGAKTFSQINADKWTYYNAIAKAAMKLAPDQVGTIVEVLRQLLSAGKEVLISERKSSNREVKSGSPEKESESGLFEGEKSKEVSEKRKQSD